MRTKHTPGNWQVVDTYDEDCKIVVWNGDEHAHGPICDFGELGDMNYAEALANAKLIAAAPDLLEALQGMVDMYVNLVNSGDCGFWNPHEEKEVFAAVNAIKKAKGGIE